MSTVLVEGCKSVVSGCDSKTLAPEMARRILIVCKYITSLELAFEYPRGHHPERPANGENSACVYINFIVFNVVRLTQIRNCVNIRVRLTQ